MLTHFGVKCFAPDISNQGLLSFIQLFSLYGYSVTPFLVAAIICIAPYPAIHWTALLVASLMSTTLILKNVGGVYLQGYNPIQHVRESLSGNGGLLTSGTAASDGLVIPADQVGKKRGALVLGWILFCQGVFLFVLELAFYSHNE